jgi:stage V sporulation protein B
MVESVLTLINILIGVMVYGITLLLTGGITKGDLKDMSPRLYKMVPSVIRQKMKS